MHMPSKDEDDEARIQRMTDRAAAVSAPDTQKGLPGFSPVLKEGGALANRTEKILAAVQTRHFSSPKIPNSATM
jgi:hypothetical protein